MNYQKPEMEVLILVSQDVFVTLSNGGETDGNGNITDAPGDF